MGMKIRLPQKQIPVLLTVPLFLVLSIWILGTYTMCHMNKDNSRLLLAQDQSIVDSLSQHEESPVVIPLILLAGQSNMQGFSDQAGLHYEYSDGLSLKTLLPQLQRHSGDRNKYAAIKSTILKIAFPNETIAAVETSLLLDLQSRHPTIFHDLTKPQEHIYCYYESFESHNVTAQDKTLPHLARPLIASMERKHPNRCGEPWGLELTLGHTLNLANEFSLVKLAAGNTNLFRHWSRYYDECIERNAWSYHMKPLLKDASKFHSRCENNTNCHWSAIVWFQGETDSFSELEAEKYAERLPRFLNHLREEMFQNENTMYESASEIPVVVIGIGPWLSGDDLSDNYHFEAASMLIIGDRVARALESLGIARNGSEHNEHFSKRENLYSGNFLRRLNTSPGAGTPPPVLQPDPWKWNPFTIGSEPHAGIFATSSWGNVGTWDTRNDIRSNTPSLSPSISETTTPTLRPTLVPTNQPTPWPTTNAPTEQHASSPTNIYEATTSTNIHPTKIPARHHPYPNIKPVISMNLESSYGGTFPTEPTSASSSSWTWSLPETHSPTVHPTSEPICIATSAPSENPSWELLFYENFEQGSVHFLIPNNNISSSSPPVLDNASFLSQLHAHDGSVWSVRLSEESVSNFLLTSRELGIIRYSQMKITFWFYGVAMKQGEGFHLEWDFHDGNGWTHSNRQWRFSTNLDHNPNQQWIMGQVITPTFGNPHVALRFVRSSHGQDGVSHGDVFLDDVMVKGM